MNYPLLAVEVATAASNRKRAAAFPHLSPPICLYTCLLESPIYYREITQNARNKISSHLISFWSSAYISKIFVEYLLTVRWTIYLPKIDGFIWDCCVNRSPIEYYLLTTIVIWLYFRFRSIFKNILNEISKNMVSAQWMALLLIFLYKSYDSYKEK